MPDQGFVERSARLYRTLWIVRLLTLPHPVVHPPLAMLSYVLMTNGGGALEHVKAEAVSSVLGLHVPESAVIVAHTPMRVRCSPMLGTVSS